MRRLLVSLALLVALTVSLRAASNPLLDKAGNPAGFQTLAIGDAAPDFNLPGIDGRNYTLKDFAGPDILMVLFTSNHCPTSHAIEDRLKELLADMKGKSFGIVAINPNHPEGLNIAELGYGEFNDSFEEMTPYAKKQGWTFPYLYDGEKQTTARAYGCIATPHVFILDKARKLAYAGRFDDSRFPEPETVKSPDVRNALNDMLAGRPVAVPLTKAHGCSTKWREKKADNVAIEESWKKLPVTLEKIDPALMASLRANPTNKYRLVNVWATWCAPCVEEFPLLVSIARQLDMRDFEMITVSMDAAAQEAKALAFLQKNGAGLTNNGKKLLARETGRTTNHYIYSSSDHEALLNALDKEAPAVLPHTVLIAPGGKIVWRHSGVIDRHQTIVAITDAMTRHYHPAPPAPAAKKTE
jgi:thiol-disulfide isomerase/thioredoxin